VNRNHFVTWALMALPLTAGYLVAHARSLRVGGHQPWPARLAAWLDSRALWLFGTLGALTVALVMSLARSALVGLAATGPVVFWLLARRGGTRLRLGLTLAGAGVLAAVLAWSNFQAVGLRVREGGLALDARRVIWRETLGIVADFWPTGTGMGTYSAAMRVYQRSGRPGHYNQAHNQYLQLAAEGGLLLSVPVAIATIAFVRAARHRMRHDFSSMYAVRAGAIAGMIGVAAQSVFETGLRMPANAALFAVLAAAAAHGPRDHGPEGHDH
jgi:O-antigen ligase